MLRNHVLYWGSHLQNEGIEYISQVMDSNYTLVWVITATPIFLERIIIIPDNGTESLTL